MKRGLLFFAGLLMFLSSCSFDLGPDFSRKTLAEGDFYAYNFDSGRYYQISTDLLVDNPLVAVYADPAAKLSPETAAEIAYEYLLNIRPVITGAFNDFAASTGSEKLTLLFLDIQDGWQGSGSYTAGYFNPGDLYSPSTSNPYSNTANLLYIDTYPALRYSREETYATIAHELQHLINFASRNDLHGNIVNHVQQDAWIDEGLSMAAEDLYRGHINTGKISYFNAASSNSASRIAQGDNFFVWDQGSYDEYVTSYLFFQWLKIHAGPAAERGLIQDIAHSDKLDYQAVVEAVKEHIPQFFAEFQIDNASSHDMWVELFRTWHLANLMDTAAATRPSVFYSYKGTFSVTPPWYNGTGTQALLAPGEAIYSTMQSGSPTNSVIRVSSAPPVTNSGSHIQYSYTNSALPAILTFNTNTENRFFTKESGYARRASALTQPPFDSSRNAAPNTTPRPVDARPPLR
jgi:hypothetical protein